MKIGILCAGNSELAPFLPMIEDCVTTEKAMLTFYEGRIDNRAIVTLYSGVCKVNAAVAAQILIDTYGCDAIINAGVAGGMDEQLNVFDTVISNEIAHHDVDENILTEFHPWMDSAFFKADNGLLEAAKKVIADSRTEHKYVIGRMVTGEQFIKDETKDEINARYAPLSVDMETASVAQVCFVNKIPFIAVRSLTDNATHDASDDFERNCEVASSLSADFVRAMLKYI